jgi:tetratricopeptide (TPR) repeat protein
MAKGRSTTHEAVGDFTALAADLKARDLTLAGRYAASARVAAGLHDMAVARRQLAFAVVSDPTGRATLTARWRVDVAAGDWPSALNDAKALVALQAPPSDPDWADQAAWTATLYRPQQAYASAMAGDLVQARTLIIDAPMDCYLCAWTRGRIAAASGDAAGADLWFGEAVRQAPRLPMAYLQWGQALLARGDAAGAAVRFAVAHDLGLRYADPLELWGEALMRQGDFRDAVLRFGEASRLAPRWGRNHLLWGEALERLHRTAQAREQLKAAAQLELSAAERSDLDQHLRTLRD